MVLSADCRIISSTTTSTTWPTALLKQRHHVHLLFDNSGCHIYHFQKRCIKCVYGQQIPIRLHAQPYLFAIKLLCLVKQGDLCELTKYVRVVRALYWELGVCDRAQQHYSTKTTLPYLHIVIVEMRMMCATRCRFHWQFKDITIPSGW